MPKKKRGQGLWSMRKKTAQSNKLQEKKNEKENDLVEITKEKIRKRKDHNTFTADKEIRPKKKASRNNKPNEKDIGTFSQELKFVCSTCKKEVIEKDHSNLSISRICVDCSKSLQKKSSKDYVEYDSWNALVVPGSSVSDNRIILCDGCEREFNMDALVPPMEKVVQGNWFCSMCVKETRISNGNMKKFCWDLLDWNEIFEWIGHNVVYFSVVDQQWIMARVMNLDVHKGFFLLQLNHTIEQLIDLSKFTFFLTQTISWVQSKGKKWQPVMLLQIYNFHHLKLKSELGLDWMIENDGKKDKVLVWLMVEKTIQLISKSQIRRRHDCMKEDDAEKRKNVKLVLEEEKYQTSAIEKCRYELSEFERSRLWGKKWIKKHVRIYHVISSYPYYKYIVGQVTRYNNSNKKHYVTYETNTTTNIDDNNLSGQWMDMRSPKISLIYKQESLAQISLRLHLDINLKSSLKDPSLSLSCFVCEMNYKDDPIGSCSQCHRMLHWHCADPVRTREDEKDDMMCPECSICFGCGQSKEKPMDQWNLFPVEFHVLRLCNACLKHYEKDEYCSICLKIWSGHEINQMEMMICDWCDRWSHASCKTISHQDDQDNNDCICSTCIRVAMLNVLDQLKMCDKHYIFSEPVTKEIAPTYFDVIKKPMDLQTMTYKVMQLKYHNVQECREDFELMCWNAINFNNPTSRIWKDTWRFYKEGLNLFDKYLTMTTHSTLYASRMQNARGSFISKQQLQLNPSQNQNHSLSSSSSSFIQPSSSPPPPSSSSPSSSSIPITTTISSTNNLDRMYHDLKLHPYPGPLSCFHSAITCLSKHQANGCAWIDLCVICGSGNVKENPMIFCVDCGEGFHIFCLPVPLVLNDKTKIFWRCSNCKICELCGSCREQDEKHLLVCDVCDRGFHTFCLKPKLKSIPKSNQWICGTCVVCKRCHEEQSQFGYSFENDLCLKCYEKEKEVLGGGSQKEELIFNKESKEGNNHCPVCQKIWNELEPLIHCDGCQLWMHPGCDAIDMETFTQMNQQPDEETLYFCPICRKIRESFSHLGDCSSAHRLSKLIQDIQCMRVNGIDRYHIKKNEQSIQRQWNLWEQNRKVFEQVMEEAKQCLFQLLLLNSNTTIKNSFVLSSISSSLPPWLESRARRYLRRKKYTKGPRNFTEISQGKTKNIQHITSVVSEAISAASFIAMCKFNNLIPVNISTMALSLLLIPDATTNSFYTPNHKKFQPYQFKLSSSSSLTILPPTPTTTTTTTIEEKKSFCSLPNNSIGINNDTINHPIDNQLVLNEAKSYSSSLSSNVQLTTISCLFGWPSELMDKMGDNKFRDVRFCSLCKQHGDDGVGGRLIQMEMDHWIHVNCCLWSCEVYEDKNGILRNWQKAKSRSRKTKCFLCGFKGASIVCSAFRCGKMYHYECALKDNMVFCMDQTNFCQLHSSLMNNTKNAAADNNEKENNEMDEGDIEIENGNIEIENNEIENENNEMNNKNIEIDNGNIENEIIKKYNNETQKESEENENKKEERISSLKKIRKERNQPERFIISDHYNEEDRIALLESSSACLRLGSLTVHSLGHIALGLNSFHTKDAIFPVGYRSTRIHLSTRHREKRCVYECEILYHSDLNRMDSEMKEEDDDKDEVVCFRIVPADDFEHPIVASTANDALTELRRRLLKLYEKTSYFGKGPHPLINRSTWGSYGLTGGHFFGFSIPIIAQQIESLPYAISTSITTSAALSYRFSHTLPSIKSYHETINQLERIRMEKESKSNGCARADPWEKHLKRQHLKSKIKKIKNRGISKEAIETENNSNNNNNNQQQQQQEQRMNNRDLPLAMQYRELRRKPFSERLHVGKSRIHGWGLFVKEKVGQNKMIVEYQGQAIRQQVADEREKRYEEMGLGSCYMFRLDSETIIDATHTGNLARFINHSCSPNAYAKIIAVDGNEKKIIIFASRVLQEGDEVTYDYKFPLEEEALRCYCGAPNCVGRMN